MDQFFFFFFFFLHSRENFRILEFRSRSNCSRELSKAFPSRDRIRFPCPRARFLSGEIIGVTIVSRNTKVSSLHVSKDKKKEEK